MTPPHETDPSTTFEPIPPTTTAFYEKPQAFYLRFYFRVARCVRGLPLKSSRWAGFVPGGSFSCRKGRAAARTRVRARGRWGNFAPPAPFSRYSGLVSTVGVLSAATGARAVSIVRQCLGQLSMHSPHTTQAYGSIDHVPPLRSTESAPAGQRRAHMPQQMHASMSLTICPRRRSGAASFSCG